MATHKLRTTLRNNEMRVVNDPLTLICVTQSERERVGYRYIYRLPSGIFAARTVGSRNIKQLIVEITGKINLLQESIENEEDSL